MGAASADGIASAKAAASATAPMQAERTNRVKPAASLVDRIADGCRVFALAAVALMRRVNTTDPTLAPVHAQCAADRGASPALPYKSGRLAAKMGRSTHAWRAS